MTFNHKNLIPDHWLTKILKREVYKLMVDDTLIKKTINKKSSVYNLFQKLQEKSVFLYAKVPPVSLSSIKFLLEWGFYLVDTNVIFEKQVSSSHKMAGNCNIRFAFPEDEAQVVELARNSFRYSRFHLDDNLSIEIANIIKAEWVRNYFVGKRGEAMIVALVGKTVVGFLQLLNGGNRVLTIDLIAVDTNHRRQGIAKDMIAYAETCCQDIRQIRVGTQIANIPSIRLYEGLGFKLSEVNYVFHYHNT